MKTKNTFLPGLATYLGFLLFIQAFLRGNLAQNLQIGVTVVWLGFNLVLVTRYKILPWVRKKQAQAKLERLAAEKEAAEQAQKEKRSFNVPDTDESVVVMAMRHLNFRITERLKAVYPKATWQWEKNAEPEKIAVKGGMGRIETCGTGEFNLCEVSVDPYCTVQLKMTKVVDLKSLQPQKEELVDEKAPQPVVVDVGAWFSIIGQKVISEMACELNTKGFQSMRLNDKGELSVIDGGKPVVQETLENMPPVENWDELVKLLQDSGLKAKKEKDSIALAWA